MSVEAWTITPEYTVAGTGPYTITHPYAEGATRAAIRLDTGLLYLNSTEFSVSPISSEVQGNLTLSSTVATAYAGRKLTIDRVTPDEQGWLAVLGEREAGLAAQLDRMVQSQQELRARGEGAVRIRGALDAFDWTDGTVPLRDGTRVISGPTAAQIAAAQTYAEQAEAAQLASAASAAEALTRELSMLRDRGAWVTGILYSPSDIFTFDGRSYITQTAHFATTVAADQAASRIRIFADKGAAGAGTGDMLKSESLSGLTNVPLARTNLALGALATKALAAFSDLDPLAIITAIETLAANKAVENALPTAKAVADYVDGRGLPLLHRFVNASSVAGYDFTELAGWDEIEIVAAFDKAAGSLPLIRVSTDNGVSWLTSGYLGGTADEGSGSSVTNGLSLARSSGANTRIFRAVLSQMAEAGRSLLTGAHFATASSFETFHSQTPTGVINAVQIIGNGGNLSNATITIRGMGKLS